MGHRQWQGYAKGLNDFVLKGLLCTELSEPCDLPAIFFLLIVHGPPLTTKHADEEDHFSEALTEGSEAGALLLLLGKMLFLTHSAKGNPLGGLYIRDSVCEWESSAHLGRFWFDFDYPGIGGSIALTGKAFMSAVRWR